MANKLARKRYFKIFFPAMAGYLVSVFVISKLIDESVPATPMTYILALIPALFVFIWIWSHARYILEVDEFVRMLQIKCVVYGLMGLMVVTTAWGFLEMYTPVPKVPIFFTLPGFYLFYGLAGVFVAKRNNAGCEML